MTGTWLDGRRGGQEASFLDSRRCLYAFVMNTHTQLNYLQINDVEKLS